MKNNTTMSFNDCATVEKLGEMIEDFLFSIYSLSANTQVTYAFILKDFLRFASTNNITSLESIEKYVISLAKDHKQTTVNVYINALKSFYSYAESKGCRNIGKHLKIVPTLPCEQRILSREEYNKVCQSANGYQLDCFQFLCNTGLRASEFIELRRENVSNGFLRIIGKGRKNRSIPLNTVALQILAKNPDFQMIRHRNRKWLFRLVKQIGLEAQIPEFHPHSCRHYFANELYHRGVPMHTISRLLGHASTLVTESVYVHWSEESLAGTTDVLSQ